MTEESPNNNIKKRLRSATSKKSVKKRQRSEKKKLQLSHKKIKKKCGICHGEMYRGGTTRQQEMNGDGTNHASCACFGKDSQIYKLKCGLCKTPIHDGTYFKNCGTCGSYLHSSCNGKAFEWSWYGCKICNNITPSGATGLTDDPEKTEDNC